MITILIIADARCVNLGLYRSHAYGPALLQAFPKPLLRTFLLFTRSARPDLPRHYRHSLSGSTRLGASRSMLVGVGTPSPLRRLDVAQSWKRYTSVWRR